MVRFTEAAVYDNELSARLHRLARRWPRAPECVRSRYGPFQNPAQTPQKCAARCRAPQLILVFDVCDNKGFSVREIRRPRTRCSKDANAVPPENGRQRAAPQIVQKIPSAAARIAAHGREIAWRAMRSHLSIHARPENVSPPYSTRANSPFSSSGTAP